MLDVNPEVVCRLVELAREFHGQEAVVIEEGPLPDVDDWPTQVLAAHSGDLTLEEFRSIVQDLDPEQQQQVVALLWVGRGDFGIEEWDDALEEAARAWTEYTADYLIAHPMLSDQLQEGLALHGHRCE